MTRTLVVWQWTDGKRGHARQCEGLMQALRARLPVSHHLLSIPTSAPRRLLDFLCGALPGQRQLPDPDLILGAGRGCEWPLLAARRARGGKAVYLMRPQLPRRWFDLCVIPRHDDAHETRTTIVSEGPLNPMRPAATREAGLAVLLLGGPSAHHRWNTGAMLAQIDRLLTATPDLRWTVSDSRRSPPELATLLASRADLDFVAHAASAPDWLPNLLSRAAQVWVSADSVSMIYEALSAGAAVGVLEVPARRHDRITGIADSLRQRGLVMSLADAGREAAVPRVVLHEAERVAALIVARWPALVNRA